MHKDFREVALSSQHDDFFCNHMYSNYGDVGLAVKEVVENFKGESDQTRQISSIEDMRRFVMQYSDYSAKQKNVTKHVNIMSVISEIVDRRGLMETSEVRIAVIRVVSCMPEQWEKMAQFRRVCPSEHGCALEYVS